MKYTPRLPETNVNVSPTSPLKEFFILAAGLLIIVVGVYFFLGLAVNLVLPHVSMALEKKMAHLFIRSISAKDGGLESERTVQSLMDRLQRQCGKLPYELKIHVRSDPMVNALALPGGHIIVFTGLLDKMDSENELAFVLAHEMGHFALRDHLRGVGRALVFVTLSTVILGPESGVSRLLAHALKITELSFSRDQETRADDFALKALNCAYGHVQGSLDFFKKISKEHDTGRFGHYFSSHPENRERIVHLQTLIKSDGLKVGRYKPLPTILRK